MTYDITQEAQKGGVFNINKPLGWTSFAVVRSLRRAWGVRKIGHAGTLDPLATGVLLICTQHCTKRVSEYQSLDKAYTAEMVLGKTTPSIDLETEFINHTSWDHLTPEAVCAATQRFVGPISQRPPAYSAIKVGGKRAYRSVRAGEIPTLPARSITVYDFNVTQMALPHLHFELTCSKGTYVRSLVRDIGELLGVGAFLRSLCRTRIGPYTLSSAHSLQDLLGTNIPPKDHIIGGYLAGSASCMTE